VAVAEAQGLCESFAAELAALEPFAAAGLVAFDSPGRIVVPDDARVALRSICAVFDRYLNPQETRHALAV
jgi:hypothetical protein